MFKWYMIFRLSENKSAVIKIGLIQNSEVSNPEFLNTGFSQKFKNTIP